MTENVKMFMLFLFSEYTGFICGVTEYKVILHQKEQTNPGHVTDNGSHEGGKNLN